MDYHWEQSRAGSDAWVLFEEGYCSTGYSPALGGVAHVGRPRTTGPYQVSWLGLGQTVKDFDGRPAEQHDTKEEAFVAVETAVTAAGHTIDGTGLPHNPATCIHSTDLWIVRNQADEENFNADLRRREHHRYWQAYLGQRPPFPFVIEYCTAP